MGRGLIAGVDGGASKTRAALITSDGDVVGTATVASASAYHREPEEAAAVVIAAIRQALARARRRGPVTALGAGLAGADDPRIHDRLIEALAAPGLARSIHVDHDAAAALAGGLALEPGVVVVAGTGSVAFGIDATGRRARAGGWGPLLDDEGSGYAIGRAALRAAMRHFDGRGPSTALTEAVRTHFGLDSPAALKRAVRGITIDQVAAVAPIVLDAARAGDRVAADILRTAAEGLAAMVAAVARALDWRGARFPLIAVGGVFDAGVTIVRPTARALRDLRCRADWRPAQFPPEIGAALLAARGAGVEIAPLAARLMKTLTSSRWAT